MCVSSSPALPSAPSAPSVPNYKDAVWSSSIGKAREQKKGKTNQGQAASRRAGSAPSYMIGPLSPENQTAVIEKMLLAGTG